MGLSEKEGCLGLTRRFQAVVATVWVNTSYGFIQPSVCRGRPLSSRAMASSSRCVQAARSAVLGRYWRQPVGVLVGGALPRAARVAEVHGDACVDAEAHVLGHLLALVPRE